jgi:DUF4097 and DUF4098 domain-containing protein YvlB
MNHTGTRLAAAQMLFLLTGSWLIAHAAEPIRGTLEASPTGEISIVVVRGSVTVEGVDGSRVTVQGTRDAASERFVFERDGENVVIEDKLASGTPRGAGTDLNVQVPRGSRLRVQLVSADLTVRDVTGPARLATVSGAITAHTQGSEVEVTTVSGRQSLDGPRGEVRIETVSGAVTARVHASRLSVRTVSGPVELHNSEPLRRARLASISGRLELSTPLEPDAEVDLETVSGAAALTLAGDLNVRLEAVGGPGGSVSNQLDDTPVQRSSFGLGQRLETRLGDGRGYLRASTVSGALTVTRP